MSVMTAEPATESPQFPWRELEQIVGGENVLLKREDLITYSFDGTAAISQLPGCVVFVKDAQQVSQILKVANREGLDVVTRGSGTGLSGGSVPSPNCLVMCT